MSIRTLPENMFAVSRCSNHQWSTEHAYDSDLLARRLGHHRRRQPAGRIVNYDRRDRMQLLLRIEEATMTCATISYFTVVLGALIGFFVANLFRVGGRS